MPVLLVAAGLSACAHSREDDEAGVRTGAPGGRATAPAATSEPEPGLTTERTAVAAPGERRAPARTDPGASSPRRRASQRLVEEGKGYAIAGRDAEAHERFEAALSLDGSNGEAYFQLARLAADDGAWSDASGYYEQAEALLRGLAEWSAPLDELALRIAERE
jgi:tetratricopeptide (TPR) repeat protein